MSTSDIVTNFSNGKLSETDIDMLKTSNPTKYSEVKTAIDKKQALQKFNDKLYGKQETSTALADSKVTEVA
jgi:hypothetical protein